VVSGQGSGDRATPAAKARLSFGRISDSDQQTKISRRLFVVKSAIKGRELESARLAIFDGFDLFESGGDAGGTVVGDHIAVDV
jgi:hypothetical protein